MSVPFDEYDDADADGESHDLDDASDVGAGVFEADLESAAEPETIDGRPVEELVEELLAAEAGTLPDGAAVESAGPSDSGSGASEDGRADGGVDRDGEGGTVEAADAPAGASSVSRRNDFGYRRALAKVREFPRTPGVYLMKDSAGRVIYVGKAKNLRARAGSYFLKGAELDARTHWVWEIGDIDFVACESEVDALLMEARLIKDIQPKNNRELKDDKSFPYLMITTHEDFPRVEVTRQPRDRGVKLYGPFASAGVCAEPCRSCSGFSSSALAAWTSKRATRGGNGFVPVCWQASISARLPAICGSTARSTAGTFAACRCSSKAANRIC